MRLHVEPVAPWGATVASSLDGWLGARARPRIGLATGMTVEPVYHRLAPVLVADATIFLLDEYGGLPVDGPGRCAAMLRRGLLDRVGVSDGRFRCPDLALHYGWPGRQRGASPSGCAQSWRPVRSGCS